MGKAHLSVAFVFDGNYMPGDGVSSYLETLGNFYIGLGHTVNYFVGESRLSDANVHSLGRTKTIRFNGNRVDVPLNVSRTRVRKLLREINPDILHVQMPYSPFLGAKFINQANMSHTAVVGTFHIVPNSGIVRIGSRLLKVINYRSQRQFDRVVSVSPAAQAFAAKTFGIESEVIPCPIDLGRYVKGKRIEEYTDKKTNILFLGRLVDRKGCQYLLSAVAALDKKEKDKLRVLIGGTGPLLDGLKSQVIKTELEGLVSFLGFIEEKDKPDLMASADVAVFPSTGGESFGIVVVEAMAAGAGVVMGGDNDGYKYVLRNETATIFDPKDVLGFSKKLYELINDPAKRKQLHATQKTIVESFDIRIVGPKLLQVYQDSLSKKTT